MLDGDDYISEDFLQIAGKFLDTTNLGRCCYRLYMVF